MYISKEESSLVINKIICENPKDLINIYVSKDVSRKQPYPMLDSERVRDEHNIVGVRSGTRSK